MIVKGPQQGRSVATPGQGIENSMAGPNQEEEGKIEEPPFGSSPLIPGKKSGKKKTGEEPQEKRMGEAPVPKDMTIGEMEIKCDHIQILNGCTENGSCQEKTRNTPRGRRRCCGDSYCGMGDHRWHVFFLF